MNKKEHLHNSLILLLYIIGVAFTMYHNEPWFDVAQAWQIARCATLKEIFFVIPHYEGHTPLWYLILLPFAKSGLPYDFSLKLVNLVFSASAMAVLIWKSPFPKPIRYALPFTYFLFYQYGVISRPYSILMLGFFLAASFYKERDSKPMRFVLALFLICSTCSYGIVLSGGIAILWVFEIWNKQPLIPFIKNLPKDKRFLPLTSLLGFAIILILCIMPKSDTYAAVVPTLPELVQKIVYAFLILPADATFYQSFSYYNPIYLIDSFVSIFGIFCGIFLLSICIFVGKQCKKLSLFLVPVIMYFSFCSFVFFLSHHIGIFTIYLVFWIWVCFDTSTFSLPEKWIEKISEKDQKLLVKLSKVLILFVILINFYWTASSCIQDYKYQYGTGTQIAAYIKEHHMTDGTIVTWYESNRSSEESMEYIGYYEGTEILPYFDHNIFANFNRGDDTKGYVTHKNTDAREEYAAWNAKIPIPDYFIGPTTAYSKVCKLPSDIEYVPIRKNNGARIWKDCYFEFDTYIYAREDIVDERDDFEEIEITFFDSND